MLSYFLAAVLLVTGTYSLKVTNVTGTTPPPVECLNSFCNGLGDGNYEYKDSNGVANQHYFLQCSNGNAYCQACWPLSLVFKQECNQCMYSLSDPCYTTDTWHTVPTYPCPDDCPNRGPNFRGNIEDTNQPKHYIGCWDGVTVGCVNCPANLEFNEKWNACLYEGKYVTRP